MREAGLLEQRPGPVLQDGLLGTGVVVRVALDDAAPSVSDQRESTLQGDRRQATPAMGLVDEDAGDAVVGQDVELLLVLLAVVDVRQLLGALNWLQASISCSCSTRAACAGPCSTSRPS